MCLILGTQNVNAMLEQITNKEILAACRANDDGVGVMYMHQAKNKEHPELVVDKLTPSAANADKEMFDFFMHHANLANVGPWASHFRMTTDGANCDMNTHPFLVTSKNKGDGKDLYMMHNGILSSFRRTKHYTDDKNKDEVAMSDTAIFVEEHIAPILREKPNLIFNVPFQQMLTDFIGVGNKLLFMDGTGQMVIINSKAGVVRSNELGPVWISSPHYLNTNSYPSTYYGVHGNSCAYGGNQHGTSTFQGFNQKGTTALTTTDKGTEKGTQTVADKVQQASLSREQVKSMKECDVNNLKTYNEALIKDPDIDDVEFRKEMIALRNVLNSLSFEELVEYIYETPEEIAALVFLQLKGYTYHEADNALINKKDK